MPKTFQLNATLNVAGVTGLNKISSQIRSSLASVSGNINVKVSAQATSAISSLNARLNVLNRTLSTTNTNTRNLAAAFRQLGAAANFNTGNLTKFNAQLQQLYKINTSLAKNTNSTRDAFEKLGASAGQAIKRFASYTIAASAIGGLSAATFSAVREALEFERELVKVSQVTGKTVSGLSNLTKTVTTLSTSLGVSSKGLITTAQILAQAGLSAKDTTIALTALAKTELSPTFDDINETTEGSIAIMRQFGVEAKDLEKRLSSLNAVSGQFAVESADLITAVRRAGGAFKAAGGTFDEFIALFTSIRQTTRESAESIATGFRTIFARLQRPATIKYLEELGIQLSNLDGKFVGPFEAVRRLQEGLAKLDSTDIRFAQVIEELGGFRQISKVIPLIQQFAVSERALQVSLRGTDTLTQDAASAQQSLLIQLTKVKEEFVNLFRIVTNNTAFRSLIQLTLELTKSLTQLAKTFEPILPLLAVIGVQKAQGAGSKFLKGFLGRNEGGPVQKFARGGLVPGQGSGDTVPAMLEAGEFVIRKNAVKKLGLSKLDTLNHYAEGGGTESKITLPASLAKLFKKQLPNYNVATGRQVSLEQLASFGIPTEATAKQAGVIKGLVSGIPTQKKSKQPIKQKKPNTLLSQQFGMISLIPNMETPDFVSHIPASLIAQKSKNKLNKSNIISSLGGKGKYDANVKTGNLGESTSALLKNVLFKNVVDGFTSGASQIGSKIGVSPNLSNNAINSTFGKIGGTNLVGRLFEGVLTLLNNGPFKADSQANLDFPSGINGPLSKTFAGFKNLPSDAKYQNDESSRSSMRGKIATFLAKNIAGFANGGLSGDTVPAMLTPGEYVINKKAANRIGMSTLNKLNKADRVQGFASGGPVNQGGGLGGIGLGGLLLFLPQLTGLMGDFGTEMTSLLFTVSLLTKELNLFSSGGLGSFKKSLNTFGDDFKALLNPLKSTQVLQKTLAADRGLKNLAVQRVAQDLQSNPRTTTFSERRALIQAQRNAIIQSGAVNSLVDVKQSRRDAFGRIANRGLGASLGVGLLGGVISSRANSNIAGGATGFGVQTQAGIGGGLSGAAIGATVGAAFGPFGIAIGAAGGAVIGFAKSVLDAGKQIEDVAFSKTFDKFKNAIDLVVSGKSTSQTQAGKLISSIPTINNRLASGTVEESRALFAELRNSAVSIEQFNRGLLSDAKSATDIKNVLEGVNKALFKFEADILEISFDELQTNILKEVEAREKSLTITNNFINAMKKVNDSLESFRNQFGAISSVSIALGNLGPLVDSIASGFTTPTKNNDTAVLDAAAKGQLGVFSQFRSVVAKFFTREDVDPETGIKVSSINAQGKQLLSAGSVLRNLPSILTQAQSEAGTGSEEGLAEKVAGLLANENKDVRNIVTTAIQALIDRRASSEGDAQSSLREDLDSVVGDIRNKLEPFIDVLRQQVELQSKFNDDLLSIYNQRNAVENKINDLTIKGSQLGFAGQAAIGRVTGKPVSNIDTFKQAQLEQRLFGGANANDAKKLGADLEQVTSQLKNQDEERSKIGIDPKKASEINKEFSRLSNKSSVLQSALEKLTDVSLQGADALEAELAERENGRQFRLSFGERLLTNSPEDNINLARDVKNLGLAFKQQNLNGFNFEQNRGIFDLLNGVGDVKLGFLGGKSGTEVREQLIKNQFQDLFKKGLLPKNVKQEDIDAFARVGAQDPTVVQLKEIYNQAVEANNQLKQFEERKLNSLEETIPNKIDELIEIFKNSKKEAETEDKRRELGASLAGLQGDLRVAQGGLALKGLGIDVTKASDLQSARNLAAFLPQIEEQQKRDKVLALPNAGDIKTTDDADSILGLGTTVLGANGVGAKGLFDRFDLRTRQLRGVGVETQSLYSKSQIGSEEINKFLLENTSSLRRLGITDQQVREAIIAQNNPVTGKANGFGATNAVNNLIANRLAELQRQSKEFSETQTEQFGTGAIGKLIDEIRKGNTTALDIFNQNAEFLKVPVEKLTGNIDALTTSITDLTQQLNELPARPGTFARGGMVYKAGGGSIFKPRGTDTVPAMLTPGEFVVNRKATQNNLGLLQGINAGYMSNGGKVSYLANGALVTDYKQRLDYYIGQGYKKEDAMILAETAGNSNSMSNQNNKGLYPSGSGIGTNHALSNSPSGFKVKPLRLNRSRYNFTTTLPYYGRDAGLNKRQLYGPSTQVLPTGQIIKNAGGRLSSQDDSDQFERYVRTRAEGRARTRLTKKGIHGEEYKDKLASETKSFVSAEQARIEGKSHGQLNKERIERINAAEKEHLMRKLQNNSGRIFGSGALDYIEHKRKVNESIQERINPARQAQAQAGNKNRETAAKIAEENRNRGLVNRDAQMAKRVTVTKEEADERRRKLLAERNAQGLARGGIVGTQYLAGGGQASPAGGSFDFSVFSNAVLEFGKSSSQLIEAMNSFPRSITIQGQHTQNIIINGGQVFEGIKEQLGSLIESRIADHINSLVTDKLPGSGPTKPTNVNRNV